MFIGVVTLCGGTWRRQAAWRSRLVISERDFFATPFAICSSVTELMSERYRTDARIVFEDF
jgi:hypothetical protein